MILRACFLLPAAGRFMCAMPNYSQIAGPRHANPLDNKYADAVGRLCTANGVPIDGSKDITFHMKALVLKLNPAGVKSDARKEDLIAYLFLHFGLGVEK
jgi:hypothetical protein